MGASATTAARRFTAVDQTIFAGLSGDANPLHMDSNWAASVFPGEVIVHGMHVVLWAANAYLAENPHYGLGSISCRFDKPILLDEEVVAVGETGGDRARIVLRVQGAKLSVIDLVLTPKSDLRFAQPPSLNSDPPHIAARSISDLAGLSGTVTLQERATELVSAYPFLSAAIGPAAIIGLASLSRLVGMECPGLHSMFSAFDVEFTSDSSPLTYRVTKADSRFNHVEMAVAGYGVKGKVSAFVTGGGWRPDDEADADVRGIGTQEFQDHQPLILGASSGLGWTSARILAAGGAVPLVSWRSSAAAIERLQSKIARTGGTSTPVHYDAQKPTLLADHLRAIGWQGRQVYFFVTPRIFRRRLEPYQSTALRDFTAIYVDAFYALVQDLVRHFPERPFRLFYPSSILADADGPDSLEYGMAKLAGERLCRRLAKAYPHIQILVERLGGATTRQTASIVPTPTRPAGDIMLPLIRRMQAD
jgi:NAD(P)-dependent dehydrogenase (short-subunit alcohol dehydrogenase family)